MIIKNIIYFCYKMQKFHKSRNSAQNSAFMPKFCSNMEFLQRIYFYYFSILSQFYKNRYLYPNCYHKNLKIFYFAFHFTEMEKNRHLYPNCYHKNLKIFSSRSISLKWEKTGTYILITTIKILKFFRRVPFH